MRTPLESVFHDADNSPLYEDSQQGLLSQIVAGNDIAALRLYHASPHTRVLCETYDNPRWHPFLVAEAHGSCDALRVLGEISLSDLAYQRRENHSLSVYLGRLNLSPIHMACEVAEQRQVIRNGGHRGLEHGSMRHHHQKRI